MKIFMNNFKIIFLLLFLNGSELYAGAEEALVSDCAAASSRPLSTGWYLPKELVETVFEASAKDGTLLNVRKIKEEDITKDFIAKVYTPDPTDPMSQLAVEELPTIAQERAALEDYNKSELEGFPLGIFNSSTNECLGFLNLRVGRKLPHSIELSIKICSSEKRRIGIGSSVMGALTAYLTRTIALHPEWDVQNFEGSINTDNAASLAMIRKLGGQVTEEKVDGHFFYAFSLKKPTK
jgi:RimJ/RimL family protein N-acetyltransferase